MVANSLLKHKTWRPTRLQDVQIRLDKAVQDRHRRLVATEAAATAQIARDIWPVLASATEPESVLIPSLCRWVIDGLDRLDQLRELQSKGEAQVALAADPSARRLAILDFARSLGASGMDLRRDSRAFRRWFDLDAVSDRASRRAGEIEFHLTVALQRLRGVAQQNGNQDRLTRTALIQMFQRLFAARLDARTIAATLNCLERVATLSHQAGAIFATSFSYHVSRLALNQNNAALVIEAALSCLCVLAPESGGTALCRILERPTEGENFWIQRACVRLSLSKVSDPELVNRSVALAVASPSAAVRQAVAIHHGEPVVAQDNAILRLASSDADLTVRLAALLRLPEIQPRTSGVAAVILKRLADETAPEALRALFEIAEGEAWRLAREGLSGTANSWASNVTPLLNRQIAQAPDNPTRRRAAQAREGVWCASTPAAFALHETLAEFISEMNEGAARRLPHMISRSLQSRELGGRVLAVLARRDFGLSLERALLGHLRLRRGDRFGTRLWRILHELRNPSTDKRQAFRHTIGRVNKGRTQAPSALLAELSQTKVPGEPLFIEEDQGGRQYLPLLDLVISATRYRASTEVFSSDGVTRIRPPRNAIARWWTRLRLSRDFARLAELRNGPTGRGYLSALAERGIGIDIRPHPNTKLEPGLSRHFPAVTLPIFPGLDERWQSYIYSIYQNTLGQLAVFVALALAWFMGRHFVLSLRIRRVRRALPLVVGGWGTRGKSGTERLKAAVFNGLGIPLISKTTGCEAMFLHADSFGDTKELFLFRPFDKATIWEQARVARMGADIGAGVVLWECMGLTPAYVAILQRQWMRDDISTITNTYPDHEDLQGPAGRNIPEVMTEFIPVGSTVLTTEEQMEPILAEGARLRGSKMIAVPWHAPMVLPHAALARFPYDEHPANIALVLRMAEDLGLDHDRTLREMADRVVPDLGVLKTYPQANVGLRKLEFVNGMSANERFGALGNWRRTGFADHDPFSDPGQFLVTVVNNRADRVPRSRVFAQILVDDFMADAHLLIGSNLKGMQGYIDEALKARMTTFNLRDNAGVFLSSDAAAARIVAECYRLRVPHASKHLSAVAGALLGRKVETYSSETRGDFAALLEEAGCSPEETTFALAYLDRCTIQLNEAEQLLNAAKSKVDDALERQCRSAFTEWFRARIHIEPDTFANGEEVMARLVGLTPPNMLCRIMGIQNIKGTGLGFIYKWQDYDQQTAAIGDIVSAEPERVDNGLRKLETGPPVGLLGRDSVLAALQTIDAGTVRMPATMVMRAANLRDGILTNQPATQTVNEFATGSLLAGVVGFVEGILDAYIAILRRRKADRIYIDLVRQRIGRDRAAFEIQALNSHQKGGWLMKKLKAAQPRNKRGKRA